MKSAEFDNASPSEQTSLKQQLKVSRERDFLRHERDDARRAMAHTCQRLRASTRSLRFHQAIVQHPFLTTAVVSGVSALAAAGAVALFYRVKMKQRNSNTTNPNEAPPKKSKLIRAISVPLQMIASSLFNRMLYAWSASRVAENMPYDLAEEQTVP